ncbi:MAG: NAD+ synthase [Chloroflexota bacterium]|nr:NAD+ synthase [Anaerolineae bacterium]
MFTGREELILLDELDLDTGEARDTIVRFIQEEFGKAGFSRAVLGLSGGIDSALACYLAVEALGPENVRALLMPYGSGNPGGEADAWLVIGKLRIPWVKIDITPMVDPLVRLYPEMNARRKGNIMARARMIVLYDQSEEFRGLVVGTSNKTEILLGYFTLWADSAAAIKPLGDLYKCQVRQLARIVGVPERIVRKAPSADLWEGQTDEGELGFSYDVADQVLYLFLEEEKSEEEIVEQGFPQGLVRHVLQRMRATAFKRGPIPTPRLR